MGRYIKAPERTPIQGLSIFLAGGITGGRNWQESIANALLGKTSLIVVNPRRAVWPDNSDQAEVRRQIEWEHKRLKTTTAHLFWFGYETLQPIALYELGKVQAMNRPLFVGAHEDYPRLLDLDVQLSLVRPNVSVHRNQESLIKEVVEWARDLTPQTSPLPLLQCRLLVQRR